MSSQADSLELRFQALVNFLDIEQRSRYNQKIPPVFHCLYISLIERYPELLDGEPCKILAWNVRQHAGQVSKMSVTRFFQDMLAIGAFLSYEPCTMADAQRWEMWIVPDPDVFPYPEHFDLTNTERKRKAREKERERRSQRSLIVQCTECGSPNIEYSPRCISCGHEFPGEVLPVASLSVVAGDDELVNIFEGVEREN